jgi:hypothetical protein
LQPTFRWDRTDSLLCSAITAVAAVLRIVYVSLMELSPFDPWRHLVLLRNLREGLGFTLTGDQPYVWYNPLWYVLCSWFPESVGPEWIAMTCSWLCVPLIYVLARGFSHGIGRYAPVSAAILACGYGPLVNYTCHFGSEGFAMLMMMLAITLALSRDGLPETIGAGVLFGVALVARMNFVFMIFMFLPVVRRVPRAVALGGGIALPLVLAWWRNFGILREHAYLFTWDGLATPSREFNVLSTLVIQMHPDVGEGLRRLHEMIIPSAEWFRPGGQLAMILIAVASVALARRWGPALAVGSGLLYFVILDTTGSARFFRIWLGLFPAMLISIALVANRLHADHGRVGRAMAVILVGLVLLAGAPAWIPPRAAAPTGGDSIPLEMVTAPPSLLTEDHYMVNSTFFHPESLIYRYPGKRFIGLPLNPDDFEDFRGDFPEYRAVLWHDLSVQDDLLRYIAGPAGYRVGGQTTNAFGRRYQVLLAPPESTD